MGRAEVEPNFENATLEELEVAMKCAPSHQSSLRMRAIWTLGRGFEKAAVIDFLGVDYSALVDWIHHFNERGIDGLIECKKTGRPRKLTIEAVKEKILPLVADPAKAGQKHWTAVKLHGLLKDDVCKDLSYSTLVRYMYENGLVLKVPRSMPEPPDRDAWQKQREPHRAFLAEAQSGLFQRLFRPRARET